MRRKAIYLFLCTACLFFATIAAYALFGDAIWPEASGSVVLKDSSLEVDASHSDDGYIMVRVLNPVEGKRYKLSISLTSKQDKSGMFDINADGEWQVFPLRNGSGAYKVMLYRQQSGNSYANGGQLKFEASITNENGPYLVANPYVDYNENTEAVSISNQLCAGLTTDREKYEAIVGYINANYQYDYDRAQVLARTKGMLPDIDYCVTNKMGVCQDLSAMAACMLRVQGIPTKIVIGYAGGLYHAWNLVSVDGEEILYDATAEIVPGAYTGSRTVERFY